MLKGPLVVGTLKGILIAFLPPINHVYDTGQEEEQRKNLLSTGRRIICAWCVEEDLCAFVFGENFRPKCETARELPLLPAVSDTEKPYSLLILGVHHSPEETIPL